MPTVAILYGLGEGKLLRKRLCRALEAQGFTYTDDVENADAIIAHSGGALYIPANTAAKAILIAAVGTGFRGSPVATMTRKVWLDCKTSIRNKQGMAWFVRSCINVRYLVLQPKKLVRMWRAAHSQRYSLPELPGKRVAIITFRNDPWSGYLGECGLHHETPYAFLNFDRLHDDIWANPKDYVTVIQYLYEP